MSGNDSSPPEEPAELPDAVVGAIQNWSPDSLETLAVYAEALASYRRE
jgi:hypothetical protein